MMDRFIHYLGGDLEVEEIVGEGRDAHRGGRDAMGPEGVGAPSSGGLAAMPVQESQGVPHSVSSVTMNESNLMPAPPSSDFFLGSQIIKEDEVVGEGKGKQKIRDLVEFVHGQLSSTPPLRLSISPPPSPCSDFLVVEEGGLQI